MSDGETVVFTWEKQSALPENTQPASDTAYIGNRNSHKFHLPTCSGLPEEKNQVTFSTYQQAIDAGYTPCSRCLG